MLSKNSYDPENSKNQQSTIFPLKGLPEAEVRGGTVVSAESGQNGSIVPHHRPSRQAATGTQLTVFGGHDMAPFLETK